MKAVIAAGGGICDNPRALAVLETIGNFVYLHVSEATAFERICAYARLTGSFPAYIENRSPRTDADRGSVFHEVYMRRTAEYKKNVHIHIDTDGLSPGEVSSAVCAAVQITITPPPRRDFKPAPRIKKKFLSFFMSFLLLFFRFRRILYIYNFNYII